MRELLRLEVLLLVAALAAGSYFFHPVDLDNVASRQFLISSVVDHGRLDIDAYRERTFDASFFRGHYYSNKAIGTALLGVPVYWALRQLPPLADQPPLSVAQRYWLRLVTTTLPFAILVVVLFRVALRLGAAVRVAWWMAVAYGFGTIALLHATMLTGHQIAAAFGFFAFAALVRVRQEPVAWIALVAGLMAGFTALTEYPATFVAGVLTIYVLTAKIPARVKLSFLAGGVICAIVLAAYNWRCFGSPFSVSYAHQTQAAHRQVFEQALFGFGWPTVESLYGLLASPSRGVFFIMPVLLFSLFGLWHWWRARMYRAEWWVVMVTVVGYVLIVASFRSWHGSQTYGPRFLVPMLPFLALPIIYTGWNARWFLPTLMVSILLVVPAVIGLPETHQSIRNPLVEEILPLLGSDYHAETVGSWLGLKFPWSVVPVLVLVAGVVWYGDRQLTEPAWSYTMPAWEKAVVAVWLSYVACMLVLVRTRPAEWVERDMANAHYHLAAATEERALFHFEEAVRLNPALTLAQARLADLYTASGRLDKAIGHYRQALQATSEWAQVHYNLGLTLARSGELQEAVTHLKEKLRLDPQCEPAHVNLGLIYWRLAETNEALTQLRQAVAANPSDAQADELLKQMSRAQPEANPF